MKKEFLMGLTAMVLAIGLVLSGCESPTAGGTGPAGDSYVSGIVLTHKNVTAADLAQAFVESGARTVYAGNVILASSVETVYGAVPGTRKLIALGETAVASGRTLTVAGTLEVAASASFDGAGSTSIGTVVFEGDGIGTVAAGGHFYAKDAATVAKVSGAGVKSVSLDDYTPGSAWPDGLDILAVVDVAGLTAADVPANKKLILRGEGNTITAGLNLSSGGTLTIAEGAKLSATTNAITANASTANIIVQGTLSVTTGALAGKFDIQSELAVGANSGSGSATFVGNTIGTLDVNGAFTIPSDVTSIGTITATTAGGVLTSTTLAIVDTVDVAYAVTLPASAVTIGAITGTAVVTLANTGESVATIGTINQTGAGGIVTAAGAVTVTNAATIGTDESEFGGDVTFGGNVLINGKLDAGDAITIEIGGTEFRFKDDVYGSVAFTWSDAVTFKFTGSAGKIYLPQTGGMGSREDSNDDELTFINCTVYRNNGDGYLLSSYITLDGSTLALSGDLENYYNNSDPAVITLTNGGAIGVSKHSTGDFGTVTKVISAGEGEEVTIELASTGAGKAVFTPFFAGKFTLTSTTNLAVAASGGNSDNGGARAGITLGDSSTGTAADIKITGAPIFGGLVICVGTEYAAGAAADYGSATILPEDEDVAFTVNGILYMDFSGWFAYGESDDEDPTVNGEGRLVYNKNGSTTFTKGSSTAPTVYLNTELAENHGTDTSSGDLNSDQFEDWDGEGELISITAINGA